MKTCSKCKITKPLEWFYKSPRNRDRRASWCKECSNAWNKECSRKKTLKKAAAREKKLNRAAATIATIAIFRERARNHADDIYWGRFARPIPPSPEDIRRFLEMC